MTSETHACTHIWALRTARQDARAVLAQPVTIAFIVELP
jgi:hypothetical protein